MHDYTRKVKIKITAAPLELCSHPENYGAKASCARTPEMEGALTRKTADCLAGTAVGVRVRSALVPPTRIVPSHRLGTGAALQHAKLCSHPENYGENGNPDLARGIGPVPVIAR